MPNLVLRTNIANKTFSTQHKVLQMPIQPSVVELIITPNSGYVIDAKDFSFGYLPKQISSITYENFGEKVIAKVNLPLTINSTKVLNIHVPIIGKGFAKKDNFTLTDTTDVDKNILVSSKTNYPKSINGDVTTYNISNDLGKKTLLFSKKFTLIGNDFFAGEPTFNIKTNSTKYSVVSKIGRNNKNKMISKTFDFFYTSSEVITKSENAEVDFTARTKTKSIELTSKVATKKEEEKIYSVDKGRDIGKEGGTKRIVVKGVPGSHYKFIISNSDNEVYDTRTGNFKAGGKMIEGVIPMAKKDNNFGEAVVYVRIPRTTSAETITTKFVAGTVDHKTITSPTTADITSRSVNEKNIITPRATLSVTIDQTGSFIGNTVVTEGGSEVTTIFLGAGNAETLTFIEGDTYNFSFTVTTADNKFVQIERQPLFVMPTGDTDNFVAWDSGSDKDEALTSTGATIPSDWDFEDAALASGLSVKITAKAIGIGTRNTATTSHESVRVSGTITVNNVGKVNSELKLKLLNFLTLVTPS